MDKMTELTDRLSKLMREHQIDADALRSVHLQLQAIVGGVSLPAKEWWQMNRLQRALITCLYDWKQRGSIEFLYTDTWTDVTEWTADMEQLVGEPGGDDNEKFRIARHFDLPDMRVVEVRQPGTPYVDLAVYVPKGGHRYEVAIRPGVSAGLMSFPGRVGFMGFVYADGIVSGDPCRRTSYGGTLLVPLYVRVSARSREEVM